MPINFAAFPTAIKWMNVYESEFTENLQQICFNLAKLFFPKLFAFYLVSFSQERGVGSGGLSWWNEALYCRAKKNNIENTIAQSQAWRWNSQASK